MVQASSSRSPASPSSLSLSAQSSASQAPASQPSAAVTQPPSATVTALSRILGPTAAAILEICFFHPIDTIVKRLMSHHGPVMPRGATPQQLAHHVAGIIFTGPAALPTATVAARVSSLYPGLSYAVSYKIAQRVYKFGGQPLARDLMQGSRYAALLDRTLGERNGRIAIDATAGVMVGLGEVMLLPLDVMKIKAQTNPGALSNRSFLGIIAKEGRNLYAGATWTAARNVPGSLALFGGSAAVREYMFPDASYSNSKKSGAAVATGTAFAAAPEVRAKRVPTLLETFTAAAAGSILSLMVSSPMDVIKTRVQNQDFGHKVSGLQVVRDIVRTEGVTAFARGIVPKVLTVGPKLVFSFTVAQYMMAQFAEMMGADPSAAKGGKH